jgi:hypothetical protein
MVSSRSTILNLTSQISPCVGSILWHPRLRFTTARGARFETSPWRTLPSTRQFLSRKRTVTLPKVR